MPTDLRSDSNNWRRSDPMFLREQLLGDLHAGGGLLRRVEQRVADQQSIDGPEFRTSSVMVTGTRHGSEESIWAETTFELAVGLLGWMGQVVPNGSASRNLATYLVKNRISDVDYLLGGKLAEVRERVKRMLSPDPVPEKAINEAMSLADYLRGWLGGACDHDFRWVESSAGVHVHHCRDCGTPMWSRGESWLAV